MGEVGPGPPGDLLALHPVASLAATSATSLSETPYGRWYPVYVDSVVEGLMAGGNQPQQVST